MPHLRIPHKSIVPGVVLFALFFYNSDVKAMYGSPSRNRRETNSLSVSFFCILSENKVTFQAASY